MTVSLAQIKNLITTSKVARAVGGATVALMILSACLIILFRISDSANDGSLSLSAQSYSGVFLTMCIVYLVTFLLWKNFARANGLYRSEREGIIDLGLMTLGKYIPGKIWGILARGVYDGKGVRLSKSNVMVSGSEQFLSLAVGILFVLSLSLFQFFNASVWISLCTAIVLASTVMLVSSRIFVQLPIKLIRSIFEQLETNQHRFLVVPCYCLLWIASAVPIIIIANDYYLLTSEESLSLAVAFLSAMISGWFAIFAPGGIGVREAVFLWLSPAALPWEHSLLIITMHRSLSLLFDLTLGLICCSFIFLNASDAPAQ